MVWRVLIVVLCCGSCGNHGADAADAADIGLATLDRVQLMVSSAGLDYGRAFIDWYGSGSQCATLDSSFGGTWGGAVMTVDNFGGPPANGQGCYIPTLSVTIPDSLASSVVEVHDHTGSIKATFEPGILEKRTMTLRSHASWQFAAGDAVVIGWSPPQDLVNATVAAFFVVGPLSDTAPPMPHWTVQATTQADAIVFSVPQPTPASGAGTLLLTINPPQGPPIEALSCEGATECTVLQGRGVEHDATITP